MRLNKYNKSYFSNVLTICIRLLGSDIQSQKYAWLMNLMKKTEMTTVSEKVTGILQNLFVKKTWPSKQRSFFI